MKNKKIVAGVVGVVLLGAGFGGGFAFAKSQPPVAPQFGDGQFMMRPGMNGQGNIRAVGGFTAGEILSKDSSSITIKMQDGSTKIVLVGGSAQILKSASGTADDLSVGTNVTVSGSTNTDGSVTAQSVQIRPAGVGPMGAATSSRPQ